MNTGRIPDDTGFTEKNTGLIPDEHRIPDAHHPRRVCRTGRIPDSHSATDSKQGAKGNAEPTLKGSRKLSAARFRLLLATNDLRVGNPTLTSWFRGDLGRSFAGFGSRLLPQLKTPCFRGVI